MRVICLDAVSIYLTIRIKVFRLYLKHEFKAICDVEVVSAFPVLSDFRRMIQ